MAERPIKIGFSSQQLNRTCVTSISSRTSELSYNIANLVVPFPRAGSNPPAPPESFLPNVPPARYENMVLNQAKVKSVLSGDSLILAAVDNPDRERILSLAYCTSPHLKKEGDEQWAFESRDALRKLAVGKHVQFQILYTIPNTKREYGIVFFNDGRRLPELMVEEGWLKLREDAGRKEDSEEALQQLDNLRLLEAKARADDKGLWQTSGGRINVQHDMGDSASFVEKWKGQSVDGLVERVLSGDRMLVRLILSPTEHIQVMTLVAGIRSPTTERVNPSNGGTQPAEEYGNEARRFVELRLLQRNVKVDILGLSPQNQLVASIRHPKGSIAKFLLEDGLARCVDFHSTLLGPEMKNLRDAEKVAQSSKKGLFKDHVAKPSGPGGSLEAHVTRVFSADVIYVRNRAGVEKRINLSSVRGPRPSEQSEAPFRDEAKEFLRKKVIGKNIRMSIDGSRPATGEYDAKEVATITLNDKNIGLLLVQEGWCSVIRHRRDDTDRAPNYDDLLAAQETAKEDKKGMWSGKPAKAKQYADASESLQKAKMQVASLQRQRKIPAIVDFVKGGSRFTVLIPRENIKLTFVLGGIRAPKSSRGPSDKAEPFGQEAHDLATKRLTQRDVEIDVFNIDKVGGFIGALYINKESFAKILVDEGFATVHAYSAEQSGNSNELQAAETRAKEARKGLWEDWDPSLDVVEDEKAPPNISNNDSAPITREKDYRDVMITNIDEDGRIKLQVIGTGTSALETMMTQFKSFHLNPANKAGLSGPPKTGEYVAAQFTDDGQWYRARVRANDRPAKEAEIVYVDYGNSEKMPWSKLRPLSQPQFTPQKLRPQAVDAVLSLIQLPTNKDYLADAIEYITQATANKELVANVDYTAPEGTLYVTLYDQNTSQNLKDSINTDIIREGHAMVPTKLKPWERSFGDVLKDLREKSDLAKTDRLGMWEYGDITED
ncbi:putative nuclease domain-containing protein 1 [Amylocarpus encephaloides]|uniref:Probable endonuclease LCL3 n=1 Tax=Amylocarpus encephaloides TaxID=45428 RepID=A0A9P7YQJ2_9HELO|nr:putative nuclease domain-containing protein 1 [Amylocarpus encephaloides]